jgi:hypothetical protein
MVGTKWSVIYNGDDLMLGDMLHFASRAQMQTLMFCGQPKAGATSLSTSRLSPVWRETAASQMARPPVLTALSALSLAELTAGKFILGVGTGPREWNRNWHGFDVPRPIPRIRE